MVEKFENGVLEYDIYGNPETISVSYEPYETHGICIKQDEEFRICKRKIYEIGNTTYWFDYWNLVKYYVKNLHILTAYILEGKATEKMKEDLHELRHKMIIEGKF